MEWFVHDGIVCAKIWGLSKDKGPVAFLTGSKGLRGSSLKSMHMCTINTFYNVSIIDDITQRIMNVPVNSIYRHYFSSSQFCWGR